MSVPKGKRRESQFQVIRHFYRLRKDITDLLLRDFGYKQKKADNSMQKLFGGKPYEELTEEQRAHYNKRKNMDNLFYKLKEGYHVRN